MRSAALCGQDVGVAGPRQFPLGHPRRRLKESAVGGGQGRRRRNQQEEKEGFEAGLVFIMASGDKKIAIQNVEYCTNSTVRTYLQFPPFISELLMPSLRHHLRMFSMYFHCSAVLKNSFLLVRNAPSIAITVRHIMNSSSFFLRVQFSVGKIKYVFTVGFI